MPRRPKGIKAVKRHFRRVKQRGQYKPKKQQTANQQREVGVERGKCFHLLNISPESTPTVGNGLQIKNESVPDSPKDELDVSQGDHFRLVNSTIIVSVAPTQQSGGSNENQCIPYSTSREVDRNKDGLFSVIKTTDENIPPTVDTVTTLQSEVQKILTPCFSLSNVPVDEDARENSSAVNISVNSSRLNASSGSTQSGKTESNKFMIPSYPRSNEPCDDFVCPYVGTVANDSDDSWGSGSDCTPVDDADLPSDDCGDESAHDTDVGSGDFERPDSPMDIPAMPEEILQLLERVNVNLKVLLPKSTDRLWNSVVSNRGILVGLLSPSRVYRVQRSVCVSPDGEVTLAVHGRRLSSNHSMFQHVRNVPLSEESVDEFSENVAKIVASFRMYEICNGVEAYKELWESCRNGEIDNNVYKEKRYVETLRSTSCLGVVPNVKTKKCTECNKLTGALHKRQLTITRRDGGSPKMGRRQFLTSGELEKKLDRIKKERRNLTRQNTRLKENVRRLLKIQHDTKIQRQGEQLIVCG